MDSACGMNKHVELYFFEWSFFDGAYGATYSTVVASLCLE